MLQLKNIKKDYKTAGAVVPALKGVSLAFRQNEFVSILGQSGCGKTTMLNIIGGLDHYTSGDLVISGKSTKDYKDHDWDVYRNHRIGFVFQSYNLIPHQTVLGNVEIALTIAGVSKAERRRRAAEALEKVGLGKELRKKPNQLSGGQMQRVAIARALVNNPEILLADEPTGALDSETSVQIMELIREIAGERLVIMVTHNPELAEAYSSRIVKLQDGLVISDSNPYEGDDAVKAYETPVADLGEKAEATERQTEEKVSNRKRTKAEKKAKKIIEALAEDLTAETATETGADKNDLNTELTIRYSDEKATKKAAKKAKKAAKKAEKKENSSMSFKTSLGLSARNLAMKKGRTAITSIAGSIGIISVCLVLALSNGFNNYILKTEEDMLSHYPLEIAESTMDMDAIMSGMQSNAEMPDLSKIGDRVYVNSFLTNIAQGMKVTNNLSDEYIQYLEGMDESLYEAIQYNYGVSLTDNLFTDVEIDPTNTQIGTSNPVMSLSNLKEYYTTQLTTLGGENAEYAKLAPMVDYLGAVVSKMPGTSDFSDKRYAEYVKSQYDIICGGEDAFPDAANEAVLVIGANNDVTDLTLAQLGFIGEEAFLNLFEKAVDSNGESTDEPYYIDFEKIMNKEYTLFYNDAVYAETPTGKYPFEYRGLRNSLDTDGTNGVKIKITGVLRLKEGLSYGCLRNGLNITEKLVEEYIDANMKSKIVQWMNDPANAFHYTNEKDGEVLADIHLYDMPAEHLREYYSLNMTVNMNGFEMPIKDKTHDLNVPLRAVGGSKSVSKISIYTESFETKEGLLAHLDAWNDTHESGEQVKYTDTVGLMMTMVQTMLDAITYVLVAFTSISLVVSSVMIGIITYVSVVERVKEIGVLRSLGARKKDIKNLFNAETFIIGLTSGVFGVVVTYLLCFGVNAILNSLTGIATLAVLPLPSAITMIIISIALTLISGLIPARAAAKKDPVVALRTE